MAEGEVLLWLTSYDYTCDVSHIHIHTTYMHNIIVIPYSMVGWGWWGPVMAAAAAATAAATTAA